MDWKDIARLVVPFAPTVGKILGGFIPFPGGAILGEWAGKALADALGVPNTPDAIGNAIQNTPGDELQARLQPVEQDASAKWDAMARIAEAEAKDRTAQSQAINETERAEVAAGVSWWHWRHLIGYLVLLYGLQQIAIITAAAFFPTRGINATDAAALFNATTVFTGGLFALLGYIAQDTTKKVTTAITGEHAPSMTDNIVKAVKGVVGKPPVVIAKPRGSRD